MLTHGYKGGRDALVEGTRGWGVVTKDECSLGTTGAGVQGGGW